MGEEAWRAKTRAIFEEMVTGSSLDQWAEGFKKLTGAIELALKAEDVEEAVARDIAFHLADWDEEARFIVALQLFPDRFTPEEITSGIMGFLIHAPNHIAAAAKLHGCPVQDIFDDPTGTENEDTE
jgi:hypothetical protein